MNTYKQKIVYIFFYLIFLQNNNNLNAYLLRSVVPHNTTSYKKI